MGLVKYAILVFLGVFLFVTVGLGADKGLKALSEKKYDKAYEYFSASLQKNPDDVIASYGMAKLFSLKEFSQFNVEKAYVYLINTKEAYRQLDEKSKKKLLKTEVQEPAILALQETLDNAAYDAALSTRTIAAIDEFVNTHKTSAKIKEALSVKKQLEYEAAQKANTHQAFAEFLKKYPGSDKEAEAKKKHDLLLYRAVMKDGHLETYKKYISENPASPFVKEAKEKVELLEFKEMANQNKLELYEEFVLNNPDSKYKKAAEDSIYARFTSFPSIGEYEKFIRKYPNNRNVRDAWEKIYVLFNDYGDPETFEAFKARFPDYHEKHQLENDIELANFGLKMLNTNFEGFKEDQVDAYITLAAPTELSITVLKLRIKPFLAAKQYQKAIDLLKKYQPYFHHKSYRIASWVETLNKVRDTYQTSQKVPEYTLN